MVLADYSDFLLEADNVLADNVSVDLKTLIAQCHKKNNYNGSRRHAYTHNICT